CHSNQPQRRRSGKRRPGFHRRRPRKTPGCVQAARQVGAPFCRGIIQRFGGSAPSLRAVHNSVVLVQLGARKWLTLEYLLVTFALPRNFFVLNPFAEARKTGAMAFVAKKIFLTKGVGKHRERLSSFELALRNAGIAACNIVRVSSIFPPNCKLI